MTTEAQIHADIEALRARIPDTQELYREVCTVLFFRYGVTPTANKLYQYVRKGSMSAPAEALAKFWEDLREKSRVRIEHPDLPDTLKAAAGDLVATIWIQAQAAAQEGLAAFRAEAQAAVVEAQTAKGAADDERMAAQKDLEQARLSAQAAADRTLGLERELAAERAAKEALSSQLEAAGRQQASLEMALAEARRDFAAELEKLRQALQRSEERYEATEKRALLEIDRERTAASKLQKELSQLRQTQQETAERNRAEIAQLQGDLGESRQKLGVAEGALNEMRAANQQQVEQLQSLRTALAEGDTHKALLLRDLETCQSNATALAEELQQLRAMLPAGDGKRRPKKSEKATSA